MTEANLTQSTDVFTKKWLLVVILCSAVPFLLFAFLGHDPGRGRAAGICTAVTLYAVRACWNLRGRAWFWITLSVLVVLHVLLVALIPWTSKSYPGLILFPVAVVDYAIVYGSIKLMEKLADGAQRKSA